MTDINPNQIEEIDTNIGGGETFLPDIDNKGGQHSKSGDEEEGKKPTEAPKKDAPKIETTGDKKDGKKEGGKEGEGDK